MEMITGESFRAQTPAQMLGLPCLETVFMYIYSSVSLGCSSFSMDVLWFPPPSMFLPKFYHGSLGMHPASVNENVLVKLRLSITYQQLNAAPPTPHS